MRVLLDTNILIHREANRIVNQEIGVLFNWLDKLHYEKCIHPLSISEIEKHSNQSIVTSFKAKIQNYNTLKTTAPEVESIIRIREKYDRSENDKIDTSLLKEVFCQRVNFLITEDRKIHEKAHEIGIPDLVYTIDDFLEKVTTENPALSDYKVLSVKQDYFGNIDVTDEFFNSFEDDYDGFRGWFNRKSDETAYICRSEAGQILAFLYIKLEGSEENYSDIVPILTPKKRLKIGTFKVVSNGHKLGERFLKIVFDNALINKVDEIYVTLFNKTEGHSRLIGLLEDWGFQHAANKKTKTGIEQVYVKEFFPIPNKSEPKLTYPFISTDRRVFIVPIYPDYHTDLFPDSILNNESPQDFTESQPHRNAIQKVYISRSFNRDLNPGDIIVVYRTGGRYKSVTTTICIVEEVIHDINDENHFITLCRKRSVFDDKELKRHWNYRTGYGKWNKPFIVNFLYLYSFPKRINLDRLIELGIIRDIKSAPRGFEQITIDQFKAILRESKSDESFIID